MKCLLGIILCFACMWTAAQTPSQIMASAAAFQGSSDRDLRVMQVYLMGQLVGQSVPSLILSNAAAFQSLDDKSLQIAQAYLLSQVASGFSNGIVTGTHFVSRGPAPTAVTNVACGPGSVLTLDAGATDTAFRAILITGITPAVGQIFHLTYATNYASPPHVVWSHTSLAAGLLGGRVFTTNATTTGFDFMSGGTPMTASTNYEWTFFTIQ